MKTLGALLIALGAAAAGAAAAVYAVKKREEIEQYDYDFDDDDETYFDDCCFCGDEDTAEDEAASEEGETAETETAEDMAELNSLDADPDELPETEEIDEELPDDSETL